MASFYGHFTTACVLAAGYGAYGAWFGHFDWGVVVIACGLTALGGLTPDLDSQSGVPIRELFGAAAGIFPLFLIPRLHRMELKSEQILAILIGAYIFIRYGASYLFKHLSVHRGMFHSIPAMLVAGLVVFNIYKNDDIYIRLYVAGGMVLGFLSHLVLDEFCSVDLSGVRLKHSFGTALKLFSSSWPATLSCYALLLALGAAAWKSEKEGLIKVGNQIIEIAQAKR